MDSYAAGREGQHDDPILAVALAAWWREWDHARIERQHARFHAQPAEARMGTW